MKKAQELFVRNNNPTTMHGGLLLILSLAAITLLSGAVLTPTPASADDDTVVDEVSITVPTSCTLSATLTSPHTATIPNSTYQANIGVTTFKTYCNDTEGFSIYAIGYSGETITGADHTKLIGTNNPNQKISTGTATGGSSSDPSNWAMKVTAPSGTYSLTIDNGYGSYSVIPDNWTKVAHRNSGTDIGTNAEGSTLTSTYASYIDATQPADTYVGMVRYIMVHPASEEPLSPKTTQANKICYYANASSAVGTMGCQSITSTSTNATLLASNFSRTGYGFAGWSDSYDYATNSNAKFYGPQEYITFTAGEYSGTDEGLSLYAVWVKSQGNLQDSAKVSSVCSALDTAPTDGTANLRSISALTDQRDNETYAIAKLADGNCWMIENLRLESTNSDNTTGALAQGYGTSATYGNFSGLADVENANFTGSISSATEPTEPNSLYYAGTQSGTATIDISQTSYAGFRMPRYNNYNHQTTSANRPQNPTSNTATNSTTSASMYSYGNYYTWAAAMANTIYYSGPTATDADGKTSETVGTSICPKGWKLPYGRSTGNGATSGGFSYLDIALGGTGAYSSSRTTPTGTEMSKSWRAFPNNFLYSGNFDGSSARLGGDYGYYWSSIAYYGYSGYNLNLGSSNVYPGTNYSYKYYGSSIRCIAGF